MMVLFSHDGIHDSQTHLSSPSYFYEQLRRELASSIRSQTPLALIKIIFNNPESEQVRAHDILHFSFELTQLTRTEDCVGRLGINEVVIIVRGGPSKVEPFIARLLDATSLTVNHSLEIKIASVFAGEQETALSILERLDRTQLDIQR
jgi:GGDEF domain-containing protein